VLKHPQTRVSNSHCEFALLRKKTKAKRIRFASHRFLAQGVRFASLSLFKRSNSQKSENFRLILAIIFQKKAFLSGWNLSLFRYFRENYGKNNQDRERGLLSVRNLFGQTYFFTNGPWCRFFLRHDKDRARRELDEFLCPVLTDYSY